MEASSERQALLRKSAGNESKSHNSMRSPSAAESKKITESRATKSTTSMAEDDPAKPRAKKNQMRREKEFEKGILGWVFTALYLMGLWAIGGAFMYGMVTLIQSRVQERPLYFGDGTFIGGIPRVVFEPNPSRFDENPKVAVSFDPKEADSYINLMVRYKKLMNGEYNTNGTSPSCATSNGAKDGAWSQNNTCSIALKDDTQTGYGPCALTMENLETGMGFADKQPCIMLRLTKILGWFPEITTSAPNRTCLNGEKECCHTKRITFTCEGADYKMYPSDGMDTCGFPYWNQKDHHSPFVMMQFNLTNVTGEKKIKCRPNLEKIAKMENDEDNIAKFEFDVQTKE